MAILPGCSLQAPATVAAIQGHVGNVSTWNAWELADAPGTVGKSTTSCHEVFASPAKYLWFLNFESQESPHARVRHVWPVGGRTTKLWASSRPTRRQRHGEAWRAGGLMLTAIVGRAVVEHGPTLMLSVARDRQAQRG